MSIVAVASDDETSPTIFIEVAEPPAAATGWEDDKVRDASEKVVRVARDMLGDGVQLARACAQRFTAGLEELGESVAPDEVELQLGITLDAELGAILAKTKTSAQLQITLRWTVQGRS
jgi:hypothetical protein